MVFPDCKNKNVCAEHLKMHRTKHKNTENKYSPSIHTPPPSDTSDSNCSASYSCPPLFELLILLFGNSRSQKENSVVT